MVTGIPNYFSTMIDHVDGVSIRYQSSYHDFSRKAAFFKGVRAISNTGNYLIGEGALMAMRPDATTAMPFWHLQNRIEDGEFYDRINKSFDVCVFTAANLIRSDFAAEIEARVLERIELPIVIIGVGIQRVSDLETDLPAGTQKLIKLLAERDAVVLTRGHETAAFLKRNGVRQAQPAGCPSMYHLSDNIRRSWQAASKFRVADGSRMVFSGYLGDESHYHNARDINALVGAGGRCYYVLQDEMVHWGMEIGGADDDRVWNPASGEVDASVTFNHQEKIQAELSLRCFFDPVQWRAWLSQTDFALQRRFHGSIAALQAGVPSLMIPVDDRMKEMLNFIGFPFLEISEWVDQPDKRGYLNSRLEGLNASEIIDRYDEHESRFRALIRDAGLS